MPIAYQQQRQNEDFSALTDRGASTIEDQLFDRCRFYTSVLSLVDEPARRTVVRHVLLRNCHQTSCTVYGALFEDVVVDGLDTHGLLRLHAAAFHRVVLKGKIGRIMLTPQVGIPWPTEVQGAFDKANAQFYEGVEWALDISEAELSAFQVAGIPARLIRRDPETQVVVTRAKAMLGQWRSLDLSDTWWPIALDELAESRFEDTVLVAPRRHKGFRRLLEGLKLLRDAGVVEPEGDAGVRVRV